MSLAPVLLSQTIENFRSSSSFGQNVGMVLNDQMSRPVCGSLQVPLRLGCRRRCYRRNASAKDMPEMSQSDDKKGYKFDLDVRQFKPEELKVHVDGGFIIVEGKHDERGFISRHFTRKYQIPDDMDQTALVSKLSSDGILSLLAPKMVREEDKKVYELPITQTNQPIRIELNNTVG